MDVLKDYPVRVTVDFLDAALQDFDIPFKTEGDALNAIDKYVRQGYVVQDFRVQPNNKVMEVYPLGTVKCFVIHRPRPTP